MGSMVKDILPQAPRLCLIDRSAGPVGRREML